MAQIQTPSSQQLITMSNKICLVSNTSWSFLRFRTDVIRSLVTAGHEVLLLAPPDEHTEQLAGLGARVILLKSLSRKGLNPIKDLMLYREFMHIYQEERPDLVFQYTIKPNIYSTLAARRYRIPTIAVITGLGYAFISKGLVTFMAKQLYRLALQRAKSVWFLNNDDFQFFVTRSLVDRNKAQQIPGEGINCYDTFNPELIADADRSVSTVKFLFIGRLLYDKGVAEYVAAARRIKKAYPNAVFWIMGYLNVDNPTAVQQAQLDEWVSEGTITYLGALDDVRPTIAACDCVVLPSYREGMSTTLQESAAMGKPLIASNIAGCKELVDEGVNGFLCQVANVDSLVSCMERIRSMSPTERQLMGLNGREKMVKEYSVDRVIKIYHETIADVTRQQKDNKIKQIS
ncbi:glycosyltransferase family 4 protein [Parapedobacter sp. 10938]|uniref:glycosyltransferase family 4 protein n=1 Tax=Parapedobacter flavus TaxID=3110225 RepID=UPI002DBD6C55|nr:glycosyltransferase family 4 protein [Parapedobacter sp. 10938]MEC3879548.1 glycosyltransferase family 4 protein [Parapedobacter sp. 10938]